MTGERAESVAWESGTPTLSTIMANRSKFIASIARTRIASAARVVRACLIPRRASYSKKERVLTGKRKEVCYETML